jgi:hypothetical protein
LNERPLGKAGLIAKEVGECVHPDTDALAAAVVTNVAGLAAYTHDETFPTIAKLSINMPPVPTLFDADTVYGVVGILFVGEPDSMKL